MSDAFVEVVTEADLRRRVEQLGAEIAADYAGREPLVVGVLMGCLPFLADLTRAIGDPTIEIDMLSLARFGQEGRVGILLDTSIPMAGRHVIVVEDIVDTGLTASYLRQNLVTRRPASLKLASLLHKPSRAREPVHIDYLGFTIEDVFVVGYGLDHAQKYRNLPYLAVVTDADE